MDVKLTPEQEQGLAALAERNGRKADELARDVIQFYLDHEARFIDAVKKGLESLDRGESLSHEEVGERLKRFLVS
jgi:predicted transcriptional regulator